MLFHRLRHKKIRHERRTAHVVRLFIFQNRAEKSSYLSWPHRWFFLLFLISGSTLYPAYCRPSTHRHVEGRIARRPGAWRRPYIYMHLFQKTLSERTANCSCLTEIAQPKGPVVSIFGTQKQWDLRVAQNWYFCRNGQLAPAWHSVPLYFQKRLRKMKPLPLNVEEYEQTGRHCMELVSWKIISMKIQSAHISFRRSTLDSPRSTWQHLFKYIYIYIYIYIYNYALMLNWQKSVIIIATVIDSHSNVIMYNIYNTYINQSVSMLSFSGFRPISGNNYSTGIYMCEICHLKFWFIVYANHT